MQPFRQQRRYGYLLSCLMVFSPVTSADEDAAAVPDAGDDSVVTAFDSSAILADDVLDSNRATAALQVDRIQINDQELTGVVTGNVATGNTTGNNTVSDGAFSSSAGFMTTIQNTGNNVLIQNAMIINVTVEP